MQKVMKEIYDTVLSHDWVKSCTNGHAAVGNTLEMMLGKQTENFELPDYKGIELKAKVSKKEKYITLFNSTPDSYLFEIKRLQKEYGYPDAKFPDFKVFNVSIYGNREIFINNHYFKLLVDYINQKVILTIYNKEHNLIDDLTSWSFQMLKEKLERKLSYLSIIHAERKIQNNEIYFKYKTIAFYKLISFDIFLRLLERGIIRINFQIGVYKSGRKFGQIYDHGTAFSIHESNITKLFTKLQFDNNEHTSV